MNVISTKIVMKFRCFEDRTGEYADTKKCFRSGVVSTTKCTSLFDQNDTPVKFKIRNIFEDFPWKNSVKRYSIEKAFRTIDRNNYMIIIAVIIFQLHRFFEQFMKNKNFDLSVMLAIAC